MRNYGCESVWVECQKLIDLYPLLSMEDERELIAKAQAGNKKARDTLIFSNLRYVIKNSKYYFGRGLTKEDLIEEGIEGLIIAIQKFDLDVNVRFLSYAKTWINKAIMDAIYDTADMIRIPQSQVRKMSKINVASLDAPLGNSHDKDCCRYEDLVADDSLSVESRAEYDDMKNQFSFVLKNLSEKEREVVSLHNGIDSNEKNLSYTQIGEIMGISKQAVRQIEEKAFRKIRLPENARHFDGYLAA